MYDRLIGIVKETYDENTLEDFYSKTKRICELFNLDFDLDEIDQYQGYYDGAYIILCDEYRNKAITNLYSFELEMLYPKVIAKVVNTNLKCFNEMFSKVISLYEQKSNEHIKKYINIVYGCLKNNNSKIYSNNINDIILYCRNIFKSFIKKYENIIYVDTNIIFLHDKKYLDLFKEYINKEHKFLNYVIKEYDFGHFINHKKYILHSNDGIKYRGLKKI